MAATLQEVDPVDLSTVLWDYADSTGAANPGTVKTWFGLGGAFTLGAPSVSIESSDRLGDGGNDVVFSYDQIVQSSFRMRAQATTYDNLRTGIGTLQRLLSQDGVIKWKSSGSADPLYIYRKPSNIPSLWQGNELELYERLALFDSPQGVEIVINRERLLRGAVLSASRNALQNGTMLWASSQTGMLSWAWDSTTNITTSGYGANVNWDNQSYRFTIATGAIRNFQQSTSTGTAAPGDVWTFSFYVKASGGTGAQAQAVLEFLDSGGASLATASGTLTALTNNADFVRLSVTSSAAPASTSKMRVSCKMDNTDATSYTVDFRRAQLEQASSASTFRVGQESLSNSIGNGTQSKALLLYNPGDANALAKITLLQSNGTNVIGYNLARRAEGPQTNLAETFNNMTIPYSGAGTNPFRTRALIDQQQMYGGTSGDTSSVADSGTSDTGGNAAKTTFTNFPSMARRWRWESTPTDPYALHGTWDVYVAVRGETGNYFRLAMHWQAADRDPTTETEDEVVYDCTDTTSSIYTPIQLGQVSFNADEGDVTLTIEGWAARDSGSGSLWWDCVYLVPADEQQALLQVPGFRRGEQATETWLGSELTTQVSGAIAGSGSTATAVPTGSTKVVMQEQYEGVGTPPGSTTAGGVIWAAGRHIVNATVVLAEPDAGPPNPFGKLRIRKGPGPGVSITQWATATNYAVGAFVRPTAGNRNGRTFRATSISGTGTSHASTEPTWPNTDGGTVTDNPGANQIVWTETTVASVSLVGKDNFTQTRKTFRVAHDADGTTAYEGVVIFTAASGTAGRKIHVLSMKHRTLRVIDDGFASKMLGDSETLSTFSGNTSMDPLVKSGPFITLGPGTNLFWVDPWSKASVGYDDVDPRDPLAKHDPSTTVTVSVNIIPRYWG